MHNYYGLAIRQNKNNLDGMINDVMAGLNQQMVLHHQMQNHNITNVQKEIHLGVVGKDSKQRVEKITNTRMWMKILPKAIVDEILPIYKDLSDRTLLSRCLDLFTQNPNEPLNNMS
eukprot:gene14634-16153_t